MVMRALQDLGVQDGVRRVMRYGFRKKEHRGKGRYVRVEYCGNPTPMLEKKKEALKKEGILVTKDSKQFNWVQKKRWRQEEMKGKVPVGKNAQGYWRADEPLAPPGEPMEQSTQEAKGGPMVADAAVVGSQWPGLPRPRNLNYQNSNARRRSVWGGRFAPTAEMTGSGYSTHRMSQPRDEMRGGYITHHVPQPQQMRRADEVFINGVCYRRA